MEDPSKRHLIRQCLRDEAASGVNHTQLKAAFAALIASLKTLPSPLDRPRSVSTGVQHVKGGAPVGENFAFMKALPEVV